MSGASLPECTSCKGFILGICLFVRDKENGLFIQGVSNKEKSFITSNAGPIFSKIFWRCAQVKTVVREDSFTLVKCRWKVPQTEAVSVLVYPGCCGNKQN